MSGPASKEQLYEVRNLTRDQAEAVAEELSGGAVLWSEGHCHVDGKAIVRPLNCACKWCVAYAHSPIDSRGRCALCGYYQHSVTCPAGSQVETSVDLKPGQITWVPDPDAERLAYVTHRLVRAEAEILKLGKKALETDYMKQFPDCYIPGQDLPGKTSPKHCPHGYLYEDLQTGAVTCERGDCCSPPETSKKRCGHGHVVAIAGTQCMDCMETWISTRREIPGLNGKGGQK